MQAACPIHNHMCDRTVAHHDIPGSYVDYTEAGLWICLIRRVL